MSGACNDNHRKQEQNESHSKCNKSGHRLDDDQWNITDGFRGFFENFDYQSDSFSEDENTTRDDYSHKAKNTASYEQKRCEPASVLVVRFSSKSTSNQESNAECGQQNDDSDYDAPDDVFDSMAEQEKDDVRKYQSHKTAN